MSYKFNKILGVALLGFGLFACLSPQASQAGSQEHFGASSAPLDAKQLDPTGFRHRIADVVEKVSPFVVSIETVSKVQMPSHPLDEFFFGRRFKREQKRGGLGSGVIVSNTGYILTNNHVVEGAEEITVKLWDGRKLQAEVKGLDPETDLGVIKLKEVPKDLPVAYLGNSEKLRIGEWVVAIGNPYGLSHTVTTGIVSAKNVSGRGITDYENFIQTDAAINPGNSGGALLDLNGALVGINTAILSRTGGFQGIGFAIPIDMAKRVMQDLINHGEVKRGWLGVSIQTLDEKLAKGLGVEGRKGVLVSEVMEGTPAEKAGIQAGDVIVEVAGKKVEDVHALRNKIALFKPGQDVPFKILRERKEKQITVAIGNREGDVLSAQDGEPGSDKLGVSAEVVDQEWRRKLGLPGGVEGVVLTSVAVDGVAARNGLRRGDVIFQVNHTKTPDLDSFKEQVAKLLKSKGGTVRIIRNQVSLFVAIEVE